MTLELVIAKSSDSEKWDNVVKSSRCGTIFHTWKWLKITEAHTKSKLYPIMAVKGDTTIGIFPIFSEKRKIFDISFSPPPRSIILYMGPIILDYENMKQGKREFILTEFVKSVDNLLKKQHKSKFVRIRTSPGMFDARPFIWSGYKVSPRYTYIIDLEKGADFVWNSFPSQVRTDINKTSESLTLKDGTSLEELYFISDMVADRFNDQGIKRENIYNKYLEEIYKTFYPENFRFMLAQYNGKNVAGLTLLCFNGRVSLWLGIPRTDLKGLYPNDFLQWKAIEWACKNGYKEYEIMDSGTDPRLRQFKSKFNPELVPWFSADKTNSLLIKAFKAVNSKL